MPEDEGKELGYGRRNGDGIEVGLPSGWRVKVSGPNLVLAVLIFCLAGLTWYFVEQHDRRTTGRVELIRNDQKEILVGITAARVAVEEQTYVLTLTSKDKEALNLEMPPSLRAKLRR